MTSLEKAPLIARIARAAMPVFTELFTEACCLNGTRCIIEALRTFDVRARPLSVKVIAANAAYVERLKAGLPPLEDQYAWAIGVDTQDSGDGQWAGHLVALVEERWLLDVSAGQMDRPHRGIHVPQFFAAEWDGKERRYFDLEHGGAIEYKVRRDTSYLKMPGYQLHEGNREVVERIVRAARERGLS